MLLLFLSYRAVYSERDDARYYCFQGVWEDKVPAQVLGSVEQIRLSTGASAEDGCSVYLKDCQIRIEREEGIFRLKRLYAYLGSGEAPRPGNLLLLEGTLHEFDDATNPGQFDQREYYKEKGIYYRFTASEVMVASSREDRIQAFLYDLRGRLGKSYRDCLPDRESGIVSAMILGDKSLLDMDIRQLYQESGIGHLLAISGLHVAILGMALYRLMKRCLLPDLAAVPVCILTVLAYGRMTDLSVSTSRAVVMMILLLMAQWLGRTYDGKSAMAFAAIVILLRYPFALFSCSFLLSFGAMAGIYIICPVLERTWMGDRESRRKRRRKQRRWEREVRAAHPAGGVLVSLHRLCAKAGSMLLVSSSIQLATLPVLLYFYFEVPVYGVAVNLFVIPIASFVVVLSFLGGVAGCFWLPAGRALLGSVFYLLKLYEKICLIFQGFPGHMQILGRPERWQIVGYYVLLAAVLLCLWLWGRWMEERELCGGAEPKGSIGVSLSVFPRKDRQEGSAGVSPPVFPRKEERGRRLLLAGAVLPALCVLILLPFPSRGFQMMMLDVGQGDSIYIHTGEGDDILVDGGSTSVNEVGRYRILPFLKSQGVRELDYMVMTHADEDHINGLAGILEAGGGGLRIGGLVMPDIAGEEAQEGQEAMRQLAAAQGVPVLEISEGYTMQSGGMSLVCLHPRCGFAAGTLNEGSVTLSLRYQDFSCLLTGDLEGEGEEHVKDLLRQPEVRRRYQIPERYTVLKVAHHGSKNSTDEEFLRLVNARTALISCEKDNRYGHPHKELLERLAAAGCQTAVTAEQGAIWILY